MFCVLITSNRHSQLIFDANIKDPNAQIICASEREKKTTLKLMLYSLANASVWPLKMTNKKYKIRSDTATEDG